MTKSHIPVVDALIKTEVLIGQINIANESKICMKRGRPSIPKIKIFEKEKEQKI